MIVLRALEITHKYNTNKTQDNGKDEVGLLSLLKGFSRRFVIGSNPLFNL
jgi:hypothetical protein